MDRLDCSPAVRAQVVAFVEETAATLGDDLVGVYLHGSLALGCFNADRSDVDLLVVSERSLDVEAKRRAILCLLRLSGAARPIEVSYLRRGDLWPWRHPAPYDLHYSEAWRERYLSDLEGGGWREWRDPGRDERDADLAAHVTVVRARGVRLLGAAIADVFPPVPRADYLDSILADLDWSREPARLAASPVYAILNHCRVLRYLRDGAVASKAEGGEWALSQISAEWRGTVAAALAAYRGDADEAALAPADAARLVEYLAGEIATSMLEPDES